MEFSILRKSKEDGRIAQLGEHLPYKQEVIGSSPIAPTISRYLVNLNIFLFYIIYGLVVQLVRTLACHARGRRFEPVPGRHFFIYKKKLKIKFGFIAQLVEQRTENPRVSGSIPLEATNMKNVSFPRKRVIFLSF